MDRLAVIVLSDLDGTLLDAGSYSFAPAAPGLELLERHGIPLILASSKTRAELVPWERRLALRHPFISENGGALFVPDGYFPFDLPAARRAGHGHVFEFGRPYTEVVDGLHEAAAATGTEIVGFDDWSEADVARECGLTLAEACRAKQREYDEPFRIVGGPGPVRLFQALRGRALHATTGARFHHATGLTDKGQAATVLKRLFGRATGREVFTVGFGDGLNDVALLRVVDLPVVVRSRSAAATARVLQRVPRARVSVGEGPQGWNEVVCDVVGRLRPYLRDRRGL